MPPAIRPMKSAKIPAIPIRVHSVEDANGAAAIVKETIDHLGPAECLRAADKYEAAARLIRFCVVGEPFPNQEN